MADNVSHPLYGLWQDTNHQLKQNAIDITHANQLLNSWHGDKPEFVMEFYRQQKRNISQYRATLNQWMQQHPGGLFEGQDHDDDLHYGCYPGFCASLNQWCRVADEPADEEPAW